MASLDPARVGAFCRLDLAATDAGRAKLFYARTFGWTFREEQANGGVFTTCLAGGHDVASLYQLKKAAMARGVPSHWTAYLRVASVDATAHRIVPLGGRLVVAPFDVRGFARIALIEDPVGALVGLWGPLRDTARSALP